MRVVVNHYSHEISGIGKIDGADTGNLGQPPGGNVSYGKVVNWVWLNIL